MKKIVVLSDTHGNMRAIAKISEIMYESDYVFHLGDKYEDMDIYAPVLKDKLYRVHGNCDYGNQKTIVVEIEGRKLFVTHGDLFGAKYGTTRLVDKAIEQGCDVVIYGHSHRPEIKEERGVTVVNPGCMTTYAPEKTFCYMIIDGKKITAVINEKTAGS